MKRIMLLSLSIILILSVNAFAEGSIKVVTTIGQITDIVRKVGGDRVSVQGLMGAGVDPHLYKASESDVRKLYEAEIIFYNGINLEAKLGEILQNLARKKEVVAVGETFSPELLLESVDYKGHYDPHIWFDIKIWIDAVKSVWATLAEFDPAHKQEYFERATKYIKELERLHEYVESRANELPESQRVLVTAHDAFRYFGRKYKFEVIGLQGISTESQAGIADVKNLADLIAERRIKAIFVESSVPERNIKAVQEAVKARGWKVKIGGELFSDALGDEGTFEGTYIGMVTHNIDTIVNSLKN